MPTIRSAIKRARTAEAARLRNHSLKSTFRTRVKQVEASLAAPEKLPELVRSAVSAIDRAAKGGAIHPGAADRRKSRLMQRVAQATGSVVQLGSTTPTPAPKRKPAAKRATTSAKKSEPEVGTTQ